MADVHEIPPPDHDEFFARGRTAKLVLPWALAAGALSFFFLVVAGMVTNSIVSGASLNMIWWLWLLVFAGSCSLVGWKASRKVSLYLGSEGLEARHGGLRATLRWNDVAAWAIAPQGSPSRNRWEVCVRPKDGMGPAFWSAQRLSGFASPPFHNRTTGWLVLVRLDHLDASASEIEAALMRFGGSGKRFSS